MTGPSARQAVVSATSLSHALDLLADAQRPARPFCGGTDLLVQAASGVVDPRRWVDISRIPELHGIGCDKGMLRIGAAESFARLRENALVKQHAPLLADCASQVGARAIQERATLGGNVGNASPAADSAPALIAHGAQLEVASTDGTRLVPVEEFFLDYRRTALRAGELITVVLLPVREGGIFWHRKVGTRRAQAITKVALAASGWWQRGALACRIGMASVAPIPMRCRATEAWLAVHAGETGWMHAAAGVLRAEITPIDDLRSTADYRREVAGNLLLAFLRRMEAAR